MSQDKYPFGPPIQANKIFKGNDNSDNTLINSTNKVNKSRRKKFQNNYKNVHRVHSSLISSETDNNLSSIPSLPHYAPPTNNYNPPTNNYTHQYAQQQQNNVNPNAFNHKLPPIMVKLNGQQHFAVLKICKAINAGRIPNHLNSSPFNFPYHSTLQQLQIDYVLQQIGFQFRMDNSGKLKCVFSGHQDAPNILFSIQYIESLPPPPKQPHFSPQNNNRLAVQRTSQNYHSPQINRGYQAISLPPPPPPNNQTAYNNHNYGFGFGFDDDLSSISSFNTHTLSQCGRKLNKAFGHDDYKCNINSNVGGNQNKFNGGIGSGGGGNQGNFNSGVGIGSGSGGGDHQNNQRDNSVLYQQLLNGDPVEIYNPIDNKWFQLVSGRGDPRYEIQNYFQNICVHSNLNSNQPKTERYAIGQLLKDQRIRVPENYN